MQLWFAQNIGFILTNVWLESWMRVFGSIYKVSYSNEPYGLG